MKKFIGLLGLLFLGATAFAQQGGMSTSGSSADENAIKEISKKWLSMEKSHDYNGIADLFASDGVAYRTGKEPLVGPDAIKKHYTEEKDQNPKEVVDWSTDKVEVSKSGDLAVEYGNFTASNLGPNGSGSDKGNYITVYRKENGEWKVIADISNSSKPEQGSMMQ